MFKLTSAIAKTTFYFTILNFGLSQSSEEIRQAKEYFKNNNYTIDEVKKIAQEKGYSEKKIQEVIGNKKISKSNTLNMDDNLLIEDSKIGLLEDSSVKLKYVASDKKDEANESVGKIIEVPEIPFFGYSIFEGDPSLFQGSLIGAIDPQYSIGPGDEVIIMLWGETQFRQVLKVDREGFIFIPEVGQVFVNGLDLSLLESKLFRVLSQSYASLNPVNSKPTTFLDVSIGNMRPLRIQVLGEVNQPGAYIVSPSTSLFSSLYYFNGPTTYGSLREIQLIRGGENIATIDFYDYLLTGKKPADQKLQLDDVVFIPRRKKTVTITGEINREGVYELVPNETLSDLIALAGDLKVTAYLDRIKVIRIVPFLEREKTGMDRIHRDLDLRNFLKKNNNFELQDGDQVEIFSIMDNVQNVVQISGAISRPGAYDLGDSMLLSTLIKKADGVLGDVYKKRLEIVRINEDLTQRLIQLNLEDVLGNKVGSDIQLKGKDLIKIYSKSALIKDSFVSIKGHVKSPGDYLLRENMKLYDLLFISGGFIDDKFKEKTLLSRADLIRLDDEKVTRSIIQFNLGEILESSESEENIMLIPGDEVRVYSNEIYSDVKPVYINGSVKEPGIYSLKSGMVLEDLILEAGGLTRGTNNFKIELARIPINYENLDLYSDTISFYANTELLLPSLNLKSDKKLNKTVYSGSLKLLPYDFISIRSGSYSEKQKKVTIKGEVLFPGEYILVSAQDKLSDLIERAGGLLPSAYLEGSNFKRNSELLNLHFNKVLKNYNSKFNIRLLENDEVFISQKFDRVQVIGEVNNPGFQVFEEGKKVDSYLKNAGGLTADSDKNAIWVTYPNGFSKKVKNYSIFTKTRITNGAKIRVGKMKPKDPINTTEYLKELTAIFANIAQAITMVLISQRS